MAPGDLVDEIDHVEIARNLHQMRLQISWGSS